MLLKSQNVDNMRNFNWASVMKLVLKNSDIDRSRLADATGLTNAAMTYIAQEFLNAGLLKEIGSLKVQQGHRNTLESNAKNSYILIAYPVRDCASKDRIYL